LTASLVFLLLAGQPAPKSPSAAIRSTQPSPEYVRSINLTIERRRKRMAARRRMGERNREAVRRLIAAIDGPSVECSVCGATGGGQPESGLSTEARRSASDQSERRER